jgi:hypothetical protein
MHLSVPYPFCSANLPTKPTCVPNHLPTNLSVCLILQFFFTRHISLSVRLFKIVTLYLHSPIRRDVLCRYAEGQL